MNNIVKSASEYVSIFLKDNLPSEYTYHNLDHTHEVFEAATELGKNSGLLDEELEIIQVAAWFHDTGFVNGYLDHEYRSVKIAKEFLKNIHCPDGKIDRITALILMTELGKMPSNLSEQIIRDADILHIGKEDFYSKCLALKSEWISVDHKNITESEWLQTCLEFISNTVFFTDFAKLKYEARRRNNISCLKEMITELIA
jgi:predicted metal-dependent HD superfamily phosphohydrolase